MARHAVPNLSVRGARQWLLHAQPPHPALPFVTVADPGKQLHRAVVDHHTLGIEGAEWIVQFNSACLTDTSTSLPLGS